MVIGRESEKKLLDEMIHSDSSELVAIYGRRRIGKTFLIREIYKERIIFELTGFYKGTLKDQLRNFRDQLRKVSSKHKEVKIPKDWNSGFSLLEEYLNSLADKRKKVVFIDEFPWLATARSGFLMTFEHFRNTYCTKRNDLVVVDCGSAASFVINNIIKNKGGLHNRISQKIRLSQHMV